MIVRPTAPSRLLHAIREVINSVGRSEDVFEQPAELLGLLGELFEIGGDADSAMAKATKFVTSNHND